MRIATFTFVVALVAIASIRLLPFAYDDAYIHFRIAENLAAHGRPYFNLDERVMGSSSLVWTCFLALISITRIPLPLLVSLVNSGLTILGSVLWSRLLSRILGKHLSLGVVCLFQLIYIGILLPSSAGLMETPLAMLLIAWSCLLLLNGKCSGCGLLAIAIFTRPELVVLVPIFAALLFMTQTGRSLSCVVWFAGPTIALSALSLAFFSTLIPQTTVAKQVVYTLSRENVFHHVFYSLFPSLQYPVLGITVAWRIQNYISSLLSWVWIPSCCFILGVTFSTLRWKAFLAVEKQRWALGLGVSGAVIASAYILKHVLLHGWYLPLFIVPIVFFVFASSYTSLTMRIVCIALALLPLSSLITYSLGAAGYTHVLPSAASGARVQRYLQVGDVLNRLFPNTRLMTSEIGGLGYAFKGKILDGVGLITPGALRYHPICGSDSGIGGIPVQFVRDANPEIIVSYPVFLHDVEASPIMDQYRQFRISAFADSYVLRTHKSAIWGCDNLYVYVRKDIAEPDAIRVLTNELRATSGPAPSAEPEAPHS